MVVRIWGTHEPGEYFYVDLNKGEVTSLFKTRPWLDRSKLSKALDNFDLSNHGRVLNREVTSPLFKST